MIKELIKNNYIIVLDTNVLLSIYRYSPEFSEFALNCLSTVKKTIVLPATVRLEYEKHYRSEFSKMEKRIASAGKETENQIKLAKDRILDSCAGLDRLQYQDIDILKKQLENKMNAVMEVLSDFFEDHEALNLIQHFWAGKDNLKILINDIEKSGNIMTSPSQEDIYKWCDEGVSRYKKEIPPGFKDAKRKDGVRKFSDLILWQELLRYAKRENISVVFVTDDVKADWWQTDDNGNKQFHTKLVEEFKKTGNQIVPMTSLPFFNDISKDYGIEKTDVVEIALNMTDEDYYRRIKDRVFETVEEDLIYGAIVYIDEDSAHICSEGISEFEIMNYEFIRAERVDREKDVVGYEFTYNVNLTGTSYDYWGKDEDTKELIFSSGRDHTFEGMIIVRVERETAIFYDFRNDNGFELTQIIDGNIREIEYCDRIEPPGEFGYCPNCGEPLNMDNDAGTGFCIACERKRDW